MGACNCTAKNLSEQNVIEIAVDQNGQTDNVTPQGGTRSQSQNIPKKSCEGGEKKRAKNALIVDSEVAEVQDNVLYEKQNNLGVADIVQIKKTLNKHFIFSQLNEKEIDFFISEMRPCTAERNTYIFKQGDKSGSYYIILEGVCQIQINGEKKRTITFGNSFGDLGILYSAPRSASVHALTQCYLVEINRKIFKKVMDDINSINEKETKTFLEVLSFFKDLTQEQKNAIASTCLTETYQQGQVIFNQGDDANSFYIIKQGIVMIEEKGHQLKEKDSFGQNSILAEGGVRSNTLIAKTRCKIISMSRENIKASLGDSLKNVMKKNIVMRIIQESKLSEVYDLESLKQSAENCEFISFKKNDMVFRKNTEGKQHIYVLLNSELKGATLSYETNSIIELDQIIDKKSFKIKEDVRAVQDGMMGKLTIQLQGSNLAATVRFVNKEENSIKEDKITLQKKMQIGDFHVVRKLREGNFGKVYACWNHKTQKIYAIKVLDRAYVQKSQIIQYIMNQQQILRTVPKFPFVVSFHKLIKDSNFIYFIMEFIQGQDLFDVITKAVSFTYDNTKFLICQILLMIEHLHNSRIIYRDLKPQNLMMNINGFLTLVDMGTAKKLKIERRFRTTTIIGTPHYMAPQIITGKGYSFPVDLWSLGVITYELLCGKLPFGENSEDPFTIYEQIVNSSVKYPRNCQKSCKLFIQKLLSRSPQHRMGGGFEQLKKHSFFEGIQWKKILNRTADTFYHPPEETKIKPAEIERALAKEKNKVPARFLSDKTNR